VPRATLLAFVLCLTACRNDNGAQQAGLDVVREDASKVRIERTFRAWCGIPRNQGDAPRSLHVLQGTRDSADHSYWLLHIALGKLAQSSLFELPQVPVDTPRFTFFILDVERDNEAGAHTEGSSGSIEVVRWGCDAGDTVTLRVDARIESEIGAGALHARGTVSAEIGDEPGG